ncbi:hypothetical protein AVEN_232653-1 [Araneus ventricosus]|uniref:Uncharacterized protein n=1 Tax=Araneus ventricosus TaxID=182803 RepID=A0A4Y2TCM2_ARAVE|nr:hypothetical protein AVEN_3200-1 [Araneus ventricosus]GBN97159.1 hypothetical protein AVEN_232653-1 [Araneus ventricosus]
MINMLSGIPLSDLSSHTIKRNLRCLWQNRITYPPVLKLRFCNQVLDHRASPQTYELRMADSLSSWIGRQIIEFCLSTLMWIITHVSNFSEKNEVILFLINKSVLELPAVPCSARVIAAYYSRASRHLLLLFLHFDPIRVNESSPVID